MQRSNVRSSYDEMSVFPQLMPKICLSQCLGLYSACSRQCPAKAAASETSPLETVVSRFLSHEATPQCQVSCVVVVRIGKIIKKRLWYRSFEPEWPLSRQTEVQHDDGHPLQTRRHGASHRNSGPPAAASEPLACCMCMCCSHFLISYIIRQILCLSQKLPNRNLSQGRELRFTTTGSPAG